MQSVAAVIDCILTHTICFVVHNTNLCSPQLTCMSTTFRHYDRERGVRLLFPLAQNCTSQDPVPHQLASPQQRTRRRRWYIKVREQQVQHKVLVNISCILGGHKRPIKFNPSRRRRTQSSRYILQSAGNHLSLLLPHLPLYEFV